MNEDLTFQGDTGGLVSLMNTMRNIASLYRGAFIVSILLTLLLGSVACDGSAQERRSGLACAFPVVAQADWTDDAPKPVVKEQAFAYDIENIDLNRGRATAVGTVSAPLTVTVGNGLFNFVETTPIGATVVTTVFLNSVTGRGFKAVQSRHLGGVGEPFPSQNYGFCHWE